VSTSEHTVTRTDNARSAKADVINYDPSIGANAAVLSFEIESRRVSLDQGAEVFLGRTHPSNIVDPQVDLTAYDARSKGVSRLHAAIKRDQAGWWITDLNSSNGTWINGQRLAPHQRYQLKGVNDVQLARLTFRITLVQEY
jgi:pSer/pThr/pTyr-binding forkhead associated (FHA) protein